MPRPKKILQIEAPKPEEVEQVTPEEVVIEAETVEEVQDENPIVSEIPAYKPEPAPVDPGITVDPVAPRKRGRQPGFSPKKRDVSNEPIDLSVLTSMLDMLGASIAGPEAELNPNERVLFAEGLRQLAKTKREAVQATMEKIGPALLVIAVAMWGIRVYSLRMSQMRARIAAQPPLTRAAGDTNGQAITPEFVETVNPGITIQDISAQESKANLNAKL